MWRKTIGLLVFLFGALVGALLPAGVKARSPFDLFADRRMHLLSGALEAGLCLTLLWQGFIDFVPEESLGLTLAYIADAPFFRHRELMGLGLLGFVYFLEKPLTGVLAFGFVEGLVRLVDTFTGSERYPGTAPLAVLFWLGRIFERLAVVVAHWWRLGPREPDEVWPPERSPSGMLEIYSHAPKPWSEHQVLQYRQRLYVLTSVQPLAGSGPRRIQYVLRPMQGGEAIRGEIVPYEPEAGHR